MKVLVPFILLVGLLGSQSRLFDETSAGVRVGVGVLCLIGLVVWFTYMKRKKGIDPVLMLNDSDSD